MLVVIKVTPESTHVIGFIRDVAGPVIGVELDVDIINPSHVPSRPSAIKPADLVGNDISSFDDIVNVSIQSSWPATIEGSLPGNFFATGLGDNFMMDAITAATAFRCHGFIPCRAEDQKNCNNFLHPAHMKSMHMQLIILLAN